MDKFDLIAEMLKKFPAWVSVNSEDLRALFRSELGGEGVFSEGLRVGDCRRVAMRPESGLLVCAGTLPQPSWQALVRLALVETRRVFVKLPDSSCANLIADAARWMGAQGLFSMVQVSRALSGVSLSDFDVVLVFGSSETASFFRSMVPWNRKFLAYGNKYSLAVVNGRDVHLETARDLVKDVLANSQKGCLSPHVCYVCDGDAGLMGAFCARAFREMKQAGVPFPRWDIAAAARLFTSRRAEQALGSEVLVPEDGSLDWTVIVSQVNEFEVSPAHHFLRVKSCESAAKLSKLLEPWKETISTIAISKNQPVVVGTGATRFCVLGRMQEPSLFWTQDGFCALSDMVTWVSYENNII